MLIDGAREAARGRDRRDAIQVERRGVAEQVDLLEVVRDRVAAQREVPSRGDAGAGGKAARRLESLGRDRMVVGVVVRIGEVLRVAGVALGEKVRSGAWAAM